METASDRLGSPSTLGGQTTLVEAIVQWAEQRIAEQVFRPGMRMPSVRQLALDRGVSRFTVVTAYERLVARGHLQARQGAGFFVRESASRPAARRKSSSAAAPQVMDIGWLARNMTSGIPSKLSPGAGYMAQEMRGGGLVKQGLKVVAASSSAALARGAVARGHPPLRGQLVRRLAELEIQADPSQILTTSGATQAMDMISRLVLKPGDTVLVGDPAWAAPLGALAMVGARPIGVPYTPQGMDVEALARLAEQHKPRMLLINTALHNPTGTVLSAAAAHQILRVAEAHDLLVVEDDIYADFVPPGLAAARLASLDQLRRVVYLSSFSKMLVPNARVGFLAGPAELVEQLVTQKLLTTFSTPELNEHIVYSVLTEGNYRKHCLRTHAALDRLREPAFKRMGDIGLRPFCLPQGGFLGWFDAGVDTNLLAAMALEAGYLLAPGALFSPTLAPGPWMRMNITTCQDPGMWAWLAKALKDLRRRADA